MFHTGQRVMDNFFKRSRFRRSRKLKSSFRASLIGRQNSTTNDQQPLQNKVIGVGVEPEDVDTQEINLNSHKWRQSIVRRSRRKKAEKTSGFQDEVVISETEVIENQQMPVISLSSEGKLRPKTAIGTRKLFSDAMDPASVKLLSYKTEMQDKLTTDSKMVELLKDEVTNLRLELNKFKETITLLQEREKSLQERLSEQARRQLTKGSTKFEDLNLGVNRPTQLVERYGNLYSDARVDALDALDELPEIGECDDLKTKLLLSIIVLSFRSAQKSLLDLRSRIRDLLHIPKALQSGQPLLCHAARDLEDEIGLYLRKTIEKYDLSKNYSEVSEKVWSTLYDYPSLRECKGLRKYITDCVSTAWALTIQNPPLVINYDPGSYDDEKHLRFHTSDPDSNAIKAYLWPALTEGDKGPCLGKGVVIT